MEIFLNENNMKLVLYRNASSLFCKMPYFCVTSTGGMSNDWHSFDIIFQYKVNGLQNAIHLESNGILISLMTKRIVSMT